MVSCTGQKLLSTLYLVTWWTHVDLQIYPSLDSGSQRQLFGSNCSYTYNLLLVARMYFMFFCVCYVSEALFGIAPFASGSFAELAMKIRSSEPITVSWNKPCLYASLFTIKWHVQCFCQIYMHMLPVYIESKTGKVVLKRQTVAKQPVDKYEDAL